MKRSSPRSSSKVAARKCGILSLFALITASIGSAPLAPTRSGHPTTAPTTQPLTALLVGTYRGTVVDDDETVLCITRFTVYRNKITGTYTVREGRNSYPGTLSELQLVDPDKLVCRFTWKDKHGEGLLTVKVTPDGESFAGSWGLVVVQNELIWKGVREVDSPRGAHPKRH